MPGTRKNAVDMDMRRVKKIHILIIEVNVKRMVLRPFLIVFFFFFNEKEYKIKI